jgi:hypothetical protein
MCTEQCAPRTSVFDVKCLMLDSVFTCTQCDLHGESSNLSKCLGLVCSVLHRVGLQMLVGGVHDAYSLW